MSCRSFSLQNRPMSLLLQPWLKKHSGMLLPNSLTRRISIATLRVPLPKIRSELLDSASAFFIAKLKDKWVEYAKLYQSPPPDCVKQLPAIELARLYSLQQYLGFSIGAALLEACLYCARNNAFKSIWLSSWQENHRGNAFYAKMQFEIFGTKAFAIGSDIQEDYIFARPIL